MIDRYYIGVDLGGTSMRVAVAGETGAMLAHRKAPTRPEEGPAGVFARLESLVEDACAAAGTAETPAAAWAVAFPGPVSHATGVLTTPPNLPGWHNVPVRDLLVPYARTQVIVANDAHVAAVGEHIYGAGRGFHEMLYMTISTGIGGGIISRDALLLGADGAAGEVGHIVVDWRGPRCNCGNYGCLEVLASGTAIGKRASEGLSMGSVSSLQETVHPVTAKDVIDAARAGDHFALQIVMEAARIIGAGCVSLVNLLNPQLIVLGGGVALHAGDLLLDTIRAVVANQAMELPRKTVQVQPCQLGDDAGLYGALALARKVASI